MYVRLRVIYFCPKTFIFYFFGEWRLLPYPQSTSLCVYACWLSRCKFLLIHCKKSDFSVFKRENYKPVFWERYNKKTITFLTMGMLITKKKYVLKHRSGNVRWEFSWRELSRGVFLIPILTQYIKNQDIYEFPVEIFPAYWY